MRSFLCFLSCWDIAELCESAHSLCKEIMAQYQIEFKINRIFPHGQWVSVQFPEAFPKESFVYFELNIIKPLTATIRHSILWSQNHESSSPLMRRCPDQRGKFTLKNNDSVKNVSIINESLLTRSPLTRLHCILLNSWFFMKFIKK